MLSDPMHPMERSLMFYPLLAMWHWRGLLPATVCGAVWLMRKKAASPLLIYLSVCFVVTTFAQGKVGSDLNYHGELSILMALTTAVAIGEMLSRGSAFIYAPLTFLIVGTWGAIFAFGPGWNGVSPNRTIPQPYYVADTTMRPAEDYVRRYMPYRGQALILDDEIAVRVGDPAVIDWYGVSFLFTSGHTDFNRLESAVRREEFAVIVLAPVVNNKWSDRVRDAALASGYRLTHRDARARILPCRRSIARTGRGDQGRIRMMKCPSNVTIVDITCCSWKKPMGISSKGFYQDDRPPPIYIDFDSN